MTDPRSYGDTFADVYDDWYADLSPTAPFVAAVTRLLDGRSKLLELGVGTGRLALPLAASGVAVTGLDASTAMLRQLVAKADGTDDANVVAAQGDMAALPFAPDCFDGVVIAYNTLFNLSADGQQQFCLADAARVLRPGGFVAVETFVAAPAPTEDRTGVSPSADRPDLFIASRQAAGTSIVDGAHITFGDDGVETRTWRIRPMQIHEIDIAANTAGLSLAHRWSSWSAEPFTADSDRHVSIYRSPT